MRFLMMAAWGVMFSGCSGSSDKAGQTDTDTRDDADVDTAGDAAPEADDDTSGDCFALADGRCVRETFKNPPRLEPNAAGVYELALVPGEFMVNGERHCGRTYNGMFPGPTIDTPAQVDGQPRRIRVDLKNGFTKHDYRTTSGSGTCTCKDMHGDACVPTHGSGAHACACATDDGDPCHVFDFNVTNLHAHGSHVRPDYATGGGCVEEDGLSCRACQGDGDGPRECFFADDVISRVDPGGGARHRWDIDEDYIHHEGLNWYHPHIHGSTAIQVASGATGAWIVRGPVDELPGIAKANERVFVISTPPTAFTPLADGEPCDEDHLTFNEFHVLGATDEKQTNLLNGLRRPRLVMPPGQIERWRFLHGSFLDEMFIAVFRGKDSDCAAVDRAAGPVSLVQIGRDGIALPRPSDGKDWPFAPKVLFLSPGYRVDTLLDGSQLADGDTLCMMSARFLQEDTTGLTDIAVGITDPPTPDEILQALGNGDLMAIVNVTASAGTPSETRMPDLAALAEQAPPLKFQDGALDALDRCAEVAAIEDPDAIDQLAALWMIFNESEGFDACGCPDHNINCENFEYTDRERYPYDRVLPLGAVEHWRLISGFDGHPFHIHINPFVVCPLPPEGSADPDVQGRIFEPPFAHWRDTYLVNLTRSVDVLTEYRRFTGSYVFHCHKLNHEDHGMMELVRVCDPATEPCDELCAGGPCRWNVCAEGDSACQKALTGAQCFLDPARCPEAILRCTPCQGDAMSCPPDSRCDLAAEHYDEVQRCVPGCEEDAHCPAPARCDAGHCVPAPCPVPCPPGQACEHGQCR